jgi:hypothetical protein
MELLKHVQNIILKKYYAIYEVLDARTLLEFKKEMLLKKVYSL